jgi:LuxR family maltose regulon positive regulatory protein
MSSSQASAKLRTTAAKANPGGGPPPLIMTKVRIPRRRDDILLRDRLVDFIHTNLDRKLILISAPAGYGKTTLLTEFASDTDLPVCWYTLDPFDRDFHIFLEHLIAAIAYRFPAFGERSRAFLENVTDPSRDLYPLVATLVQEIYDAIPEYFVLILDDHHSVEDQEQINEFLDLFVTYVDENCHLILSSRTLPALPNLSLLVARRQATGLSIDELRFTPEEIQALAQQNYNLKLSPEQANTLSQQTGGWITGLLLTAIPHWEQARRQVPTRGRIQVDLYDYLSKQVLDQQPDRLRDFLLASSVLDEMSPRLCAEVLEIDRAADLMAQLRTRNLFVIEFEGDEGRLRYHDLFREFLQTTLRRESEVRFQELTHRAARAYADRGEWERAASRFLALQEYGSMIQIIERTAADLFDAGRWDTLAGWIDALPEEIREAKPSFLVHRGKIYMDRGEHSRATTLYDQAQQAFAGTGDRTGEAYALAMKGYVLRFKGQYTQAVESCQEALLLVNGTGTRQKATSALAYRNVGLCQFRLGQLAKGQEALEQALHLYRDLNAPYDVGMVHHDLGLGYELAGDLEGATTHYQAALQRWQQLGNPGPWANTLNSLGVIHYLLGQYDQASETLNEALAKARQSGNLRVEALIWASLGDLHRDLGAFEQARQAYSEGLQAANRAGAAFEAIYCLDALGNISRLQGDLIQARSRLLDAEKRARQHGSTYEMGMCHTSQGLLASDEGDLATARQHLDRAVELFEASGFKQQLSRARLYHAQVAFLAGDEQEAMTEVAQALSLLEQLNADQFLVVEGHRLSPLLSCAAEHGIGEDILPHLLDRIEAYQSMLAERPEPSIPAEPKHTLAIYSLGQPRVELNGENVQWTIAQSRDLFFCLLQHPQGLRKEEIGEIFWPDHPPVKLDSIFRSTLYRLRRALFRESVVFDEGIYSFNRESDYWFDVESFEELLDEAEQIQAIDKKREIAILEDALALFRSDYLEGIYDEWCVLERERLRGRYLVALDRLASLYADRRDLQRAIELYQQLLARDPYHEGTHRELMRCYFRLGDRAAAIRQYQSCAELLREDLGLSPAPETESLYLQIIG